VRRDLNPLMQERMQHVCYYLSVTTPFGKRIVELITSYTVGEGFKVTANDRRRAGDIDRFTSDEINDFRRRSRTTPDEFVKFGEICIPVAVNEVDGFVRLGHKDPVEIKAIEFGQMQTSSGLADVTFPVAVQLKQQIGEPNGRKPRNHPNGR
jgi:hypothetical protein